MEKSLNWHLKNHPLSTEKQTCKKSKKLTMIGIPLGSEGKIKIGGESSCLIHMLANYYRKKRS